MRAGSSRRARSRSACTARRSRSPGIPRRPTSIS
jgi:hypothetical protein